MSASPTVLEVAEHHDHREIATFFLGWACMTSLQCLLSSGWIQSIYRRTIASGAPESDSEKGPSTYDNASVSLEAVSPPALFVLSLCFVFASIAQFSSLLSFSSGESTVCAFLVAWGGISAQFARLVALSIVLVALRRLGIGLVETLAYVSWLLVGLGLAFANYAVGTGSISNYELLDINLCHRQHILELSLTLSFVYSLLEVYAIGRILSLTYSQSRHVMNWLGDQPVLQSFSLLILELLTVVPSAIFTGILGEFIPFSIGTIIVLLTFHHTPSTPNVCYDGPSDATAVRDFYLKSNPYAPSIQSYRSSYQPRRSVRQSVAYSITPALISHPYSSKYPDDVEPDTHRWTINNGRRTARSSRTIDSRSLRSAGEAVVEVARRARPPLQSSQDNNRTVPAIPHFDSTISLVRARLVMLNTSQKYLNDQVKPDSPTTVDTYLQQPTLEPKSHFSVSTRTASTCPRLSLPPSPLPLGRRSSGLSSVVRVLGGTGDRDIYPPLPDSPVVYSPHSVAAFSDQHFVVSEGSGQLVTITPPSPEEMVLQVGGPSDGRPTQFRAAGFKNPIPLPKFPRDVRVPVARMM